jgi:hypothetical protein
VKYKNVRPSTDPSEKRACRRSSLPLHANPTTSECTSRTWIRSLTQLAPDTLAIYSKHPVMNKTLHIYGNKGRRNKLQTPYTCRKLLQLALTEREDVKWTMTSQQQGRHGIQTGILCKRNQNIHPGVILMKCCCIAKNDNVHYTRTHQPHPCGSGTYFIKYLWQLSHTQNPNC